MEDIVHHVLESCRGVGEAKEHNSRFKESSIGNERRFPFVAFFYADVLVTPPYIEFSKVFGALKFIHEVRDKRKGITVPNCDVVESTVVLDRPK